MIKLSLYHPVESLLELEVTQGFSRRDEKTLQVFKNG
jgi:hypothetical protein